MNGRSVTANTAGTESTANTTSVSSIAISASRQRATAPVMKRVRELRVHGCAAQPAAPALAAVLCAARSILSRGR